VEAPRIGLCCATVMKAGVVELIEVAARHGFPTITVRPTTVVAALDAGVTERELRRRLNDAGVRVAMLDALTSALPGVAIPDISDPKLRALLPDDVFFPPDQETCLRATEILEAPCLNVTHYGGAPMPADQLFEPVATICKAAGKRGIAIALEFIPGTGIRDIQTAELIARSCGEPNCGILLDPWHLDRSGGTVEDVRALAPHALAGMQLCDRIPDTPGAAYVPLSGRLMPGEGQIRLYELVQAALGNSPGITIEVELLNDEVRAMTPDEAGAHVAAGVAKWRAGFPAD